MKCKTHPDIDASTQCKVCDVYLCKKCAIPSGDNLFVCSRCHIKDIGEGMVRQRNEWESKKADRERLVEKKQKKQARIRRNILFFIVAAVLVAELVIYFSAPDTYMPEYEPSEPSLVWTMILEEAIAEYASDHEGRVPQRLDELMSEYLPLDETELPDPTGFHYKRLSPYSYELHPRDLEDIP